MDWDNSRQTSNSQNNSVNPQLYAYTRRSCTAAVAGGLRTGTKTCASSALPAPTRRSATLPSAPQVIATVTQICDIYWDLVEAYDTEQVGERTVAFAQETLDKSRKQLELKAIPEMDVLKAEGDLAQRQQDLDHCPHHS